MKIDKEALIRKIISEHQATAGFDEDYMKEVSVGVRVAVDHLEDTLNYLHTRLDSLEAATAVEEGTPT